jgi:uncharacterized protein YndB with AHSA1/START domain
MSTTLIAKKTIKINAPAAKVWEALTTPKIIKQYFYETDVQTTWEVGSPIVFRGEWDGEVYEDKGVIKDFDPEKRLNYTYWSSMSGKEDTPENYCTIRYDLYFKDGKTELLITQDNIKDKAEKERCEQNWGQVQQRLKELLEQ